MCICTKVESKVSTIDINFIGLFEYNFKNDIESIVVFTCEENTYSFIQMKQKSKDETEAKFLFAVNNF